MYLVTTDPTYQGLDESSVKFCSNEKHLPGFIDLVAKHTENGRVFVWKLVEQHTVIVTVESIPYVVNDNGEVLPK
jgi:hypothetical protein